MSLKEVYSLAHSAQCKLYLSADRPDRNLRFLVGHAMHLDSLMLRIVEIEGSMEKQPHAPGISAKHAPGSPPRCGLGAESDSDDSDDDAENENAGDEEELGLTRFPPGSARQSREPSPQHQHFSDDNSSSSDEDYNFDLDFLRGVVTESDGDEGLKSLYQDVQTCRCHKSDAPAVERMWELPSEGGQKGVRVAVAEIRV